LFNFVDSDKNGFLDFREFLTLIQLLFRRGLRPKDDIIQERIIKQDSMKDLKDLLSVKSKFNHEKEINVVVMLVIAPEEIEPVLNMYNVVPNEEMDKEFLGLAHVRNCRIEEGGNGYELYVLEVSHSRYYNRHYSGHTQSSAVSALVVKVLNPDIFISFGTAGGIIGKVVPGEVVLASGCVFIDRFRTSSKNSFDWGVYGGPTMESQNLINDLNIKCGIIGSQDTYSVTDIQVQLIDMIDIYCVDMEAASESQILQQTGTNFLAIKVISNLVYPGEPIRMEQEYLDHKVEVSRSSLAILSKVLSYLVGKKIGDL